MKNCKDCGKEVSRTAKTCPNCGARLGMSAWKKLGIALVAPLAIVGFIGGLADSSKYGEPPKPPPSPEEVAAKEKAERDFQHVVRILRSIKVATKNPDSFTVSNVVQVADGTICVEYRGTNSFNAVVPGRAVARNESISTTDADWNRHCAGKSGKDYSYARMAL